uniref:Uncharacterized protein n=1 Tax=Piliocolobus tephrosceles TaxID=591936 RepID=A0A8C9I7L2_9PRIM
MGAVAKSTFWEAPRRGPCLSLPWVCWGPGKRGTPPGGVVGGTLRRKGSSRPRKAVTLPTEARSCQGWCRIRAVGGRPLAPAPVLGRLPGLRWSHPLQGRGGPASAGPSAPEAVEAFPGPAKGLCPLSQTP